MNWEMTEVLFYLIPGRQKMHNTDTQEKESGSAFMCSVLPREKQTFMRDQE